MNEIKKEVKAAILELAVKTKREQDADKAVQFSHALGKCVDALAVIDLLN